MEQIRNISSVPTPYDASITGSNREPLAPDGHTASDCSATRADGWTAERIRIFLDTLAETSVVAAALRAVGMRKQGAYAFRKRSSAFDAAWRSALRAHEPVASDFTSRALHGRVEPIVRGGKLWGERHRFDNRLSMAVLARLDRLAESVLDEAAACFAQDFEAFVDSLCAGEAPTAVVDDAASAGDASQPSTWSTSMESPSADGADAPLGDRAWQPSTWSFSLDYLPTGGRVPAQSGRRGGAHALGIRAAGARGPPRHRSRRIPVRARPSSAACQAEKQAPLRQIGEGHLAVAVRPRFVPDRPILLRARP